MHVQRFSSEEAIDKAGERKYGIAVRRLHSLIFLCLLLASCTGRQLTIVSPDGAKKVSLTVEEAITPDAREKGLMHRTSLGKDSGMLFVFPNEQMLTFWMKDTPIPLDIIFFDAKGRMTSAEDHATPCRLEPCTYYKSREVSKYVLEVHAGYRVAHDIGVGWQFDPRTVSEAKE